MTSLSTHLNDKELWKIDKDEVAYYGHMALNTSLEKLIDTASNKRDDHWGNVITLQKNFCPINKYVQRHLQLLHFCKTSR